MTPFRVSFNFFRRKSAEVVHPELIHLQFDRNRVTTKLSRTHLRRKAIAVKEWVKCFFTPFWSDTSLKYFIFSPYVVVQFLTIYVPFEYTPICFLFILPSWISVLEMYFSYLNTIRQVRWYEIVLNTRNNFPVCAGQVVWSNLFLLNTTQLQILLFPHSLCKTSTFTTLSLYL